MFAQGGRHTLREEISVRGGCHEMLESHRFLLERHSLQAPFSFLRRNLKNVSRSASAFLIRALSYVISYNP